MEKSLSFKFEVRHAPNNSFQRTRVRGGRGPGPLNSKRYVATNRIRSRSRLAKLGDYID